MMSRPIVGLWMLAPPRVTAKSIARAIVHHPAVILCDEPTMNLDSATSEVVMTLLKQINQKLGTTFLLVTHDNEVAQQCNRVLTMDDGLIIDSGRGEEEE